MLKQLNEEMRQSSHAVMRSAVAEVFEHYFNDETLAQLKPQEIQMLSDLLTARLIKEVSNEVLYRTHQVTKD